MNAWWHLTEPWWVYAVRGAVVYAGLLLLLRLVGKRSFGEMTSFDIVVLMLVGGTLRTAIVGEDKSLLAAFIGVLAIFAVDKLIGLVCARSAWADRWIEGKDSVLARNGKVLDDSLRRHEVSPAAFARALREHGLRGVEEVAEARLEANGKISVRKTTRAS
jgi:uncharacterized membrane protein YcaP (DUF421 family)